MDYGAPLFHHPIYAGSIFRIIPAKGGRVRLMEFCWFIQGIGSEVTLPLATLLPSYKPESEFKSS